MPRLPTVGPSQVVQALERAGYEIDHQSGSHVVRGAPATAAERLCRGTAVIWGAG